MATARALVADATNRLTQAGVASPSVDAAELLAHVLGTTRTRLLLQDAVSDDDARRFEKLVVKRMSRVPLQHLTGSAAFRFMELAVGPGVFIPRPETELLAEIAIRELRQLGGGGVAVDLCAGSGAVAISIATECRDCEVTAVELSDDALPWLVKNAESHLDAVAAANSVLQVLHQSATQVGDLAHLVGRCDVVTSNPPYIPDAMVPVDPEVLAHDPHMALFGGRDGLDVVRGLLPVAHALLKPGGLLAIEHADVQGETAGDKGVPEVLRAAGWVEVVDHDDLNGRPRTTVARRSAA